MSLPHVPIVGPTTQTPDPARPDSVIQVERNNRRGRVEILTSRDGGRTRRVLLPEPDRDIPVGSGPQITETGDVEWLPPFAGAAAATSGYASVNPAIPALTTFVEFHQSNTLVVNQGFGFYRNPFGVVQYALGAQYFIQTPSLGADVSFVLVDEFGIEQPQGGTLAAGLERATVTFNQPLAMNPGTGWGPRVKTIGSTRAGECLSVRLLLTFSL